MVVNKFNGHRKGEFTLGASLSVFGVPEVKNRLTFVLKHSMTENVWLE